MALKIGIVGLPNVGPEQSLARAVNFVYALEERLYGAIPHSTGFSYFLHRGGIRCH